MLFQETFQRDIYYYYIRNTLERSIKMIGRTKTLRYDIRQKECLHQIEDSAKKCLTYTKETSWRHSLNFEKRFAFSDWHCAYGWEIIFMRTLVLSCKDMPFTECQNQLGWKRPHQIKSNLWPNTNMSIRPWHWVPHLVFS